LIVIELEFIVLSRITSTQALIFTATALGLSVLANVLLIVDQSNLQTTLDIKENDLALLSQQVEENKQFKTDQLTRLDEMDGNQRELGEFVRELQAEITNLNFEYIKTKETATQTRTQLANSQQQINSLQTSLESQKQLLDNANATIANQQRALKLSQTTQNQNPAVGEIAQGLATDITEINTLVSVTQSQAGDVIINIPLLELFESGTLTIKTDATNYLRVLANYLIEFPNINANVIGHSDSRPIVSDLANSYPTNWELSSARASKVVNFLIQNGITENRLIASGKAANQPVRDTETEEAYAVNRRIEIRLN
jgi:chemotaxis protein MotB